MKRNVWLDGMFGVVVVDAGGKSNKNKRKF